MHWVQLWRGAGGALRLRLCDGKPTELPGEDAAMQQQQQFEEERPAPNAAAEDTALLLSPGRGVAAVVHTAPAGRTPGVSDAAAAQATSARAAAAHAAAMIVGAAAQAVADAAAPWQLHAPTCRRVHCTPAAGAALQGCCLLGAAGAGADGVVYAAASHPPKGDYQGPLPTARRRTGDGDGGGSGPATIWGAGRDCGGADGHGLLDAAAAQPCRGGNVGSADHLLSLSPAPLPPPPLPPPGVLGQPAVAGDVFSLWRRAVWASQQHSVLMHGLQQEQQQQQQQQDQGGSAVSGRPCGTGILTGRVGKRRISLRTEEVQGLLAPSLLQGRGPQSRPDWITVHVEEAAGNNAAHEGAQQGLQQGSEFTVRLVCYQEAGCKPRWQCSGVSALVKALRALDGDTVQLQYMPDGRLVIWRAAHQPPQQKQQQCRSGAVPLAACPADSILVGYRYDARIDVPAAAVHSLWPEVASQLACGQSAEVEAHVAVADAGGEAPSPFRLTLKLHTWRRNLPSWRLNGCGPLFRTLGARYYEGILMWRSPGDGRLMAGVQPRCGVQRGREEQQQGQQGQQAGQQAGQQQEARQGQQGDGSRRQPRRTARQGGLHRLYGEYVVPEALDGEDGEEDEPSDDGDGGVEKWESEESEEGQEEGPSGSGLSRPSKRARAAQGGAHQQYGGLSATQQQQQHMQLAACPAGSLLVGSKYRTQLDVRAAAVHPLWPDLASQLACGQGTEVEVHVAVEHAGGEALVPYRPELKLRTWKGRSPTWRLTGCGPLFRALGAQDRDAIFMWRSPGDGRMMAGVQPREAARGGGGCVQVGQRGAGLVRAGGKVRQVYDEYDVRESTDEGGEEGEEAESEETEEGSGGYREEEEEEEEEEGEEEEEEQDGVGFGGEASFGAGSEGEGRVGQGSGVVGGRGGGWSWEEEGLRCGGGNGAGVGEDEAEEEEAEAEDPGVNCWAREVGEEFGFGEESDEGEQNEEQV